RPYGKGRRGLVENYKYSGVSHYLYMWPLNGFRSYSAVQHMRHLGGPLLSITGSYRHLTDVVRGDPEYVRLKQ
ncbi:uncharacterized protein F5891DRAFT_948213, partial [Suillus fuscotomentosus]